MNFTLKLFSRHIRGLGSNFKPCCFPFNGITKLFFGFFSCFLDFVIRVLDAFGVSECIEDLLRCCSGVGFCRLFLRRGLKKSNFFDRHSMLLL